MSIIRPYSSTSLMRPVATDGAVRSVGHDCQPAKMAELIKMPFGMWTRVGPRNHVLGGVQAPPGKYD